MSVQVFSCSAARRSLCSSCLLSRRTSAYYSQSVAGRIQDSEVSVSARTGARTLTATWSDSHRTVTSARNPLDPTRLDRYLASIDASDLEPTLGDVERCKPDSFPRPDSTRYATDYTTLLETLCRSFSKDQLRHFTELYKLDPIWTRSSRRKTEYAESIIEKAWGWPSLKEIERKRRDMTEVLIKSFAVTPSQLFLMMGRDGADLLQLSTQYNVHISLTSNPLSLCIEGLRGSLKGVAEYISLVKKGIVDEIFELPTGRPIRPDLLQRISRLAGAYIENHGHRGKVRICAKNLDEIITAKRLALRASLEFETQARTICLDPPNKMRNSPVEISEPHRYSIYPFVTPSSLPWTMNPGGAFRLRRVADWLGVNSYEDIVSTGGLADNPHRLLNLDQNGEPSQLVCPTVSESTLYCQTTITASLGHILLSSGDNSQRATIFPPLRGASSLPDILKWVKTSSTPLTFVPSVPPAMMTVTVGERRALHRLIYKTLPLDGQVSKLPQLVMKFEVELSDLLSTGTRATQYLESPPQPKDVPSFDESNSNADPVSSKGVLQPDALSEMLRNSSCQVGRETYVNLMLPDRPMDIQLCVFDWDDIALMHQPQLLQEYAKNFLTNKASLPQPNPPSTLNYEGRAYYLYDNLSLRQNTDANLLSTISNDQNMDNSVKVCVESIVDLQSTQKTELFQAKFDGTTDGPGWRRFLATCDQLSVVSLQSRGNDGPRTGYFKK